MKKNPPAIQPRYVTTLEREVNRRKWKHAPKAPPTHSRKKGNRLHTTYRLWLFVDARGRRAKFTRRKKLSAYLYRVTRIELAKPKPPTAGPWQPALPYLKGVLASYKIPWGAWGEEEKKLLPKRRPLAAYFARLDFFNKDPLTNQRLGMTGRPRAQVSEDIEWWSICRVPHTWSMGSDGRGGQAVGGRVGSDPADIPKGAVKAVAESQPSKVKGPAKYVLLGLPHHWEPPPGELRKARQAEEAGVHFTPTDPGYTPREFYEHMHRPIWSKTLKRRNVRWKAHIAQYQRSYNQRFRAKLTIEPVRFLGFAVRMWL